MQTLVIPETDHWLAEQAPDRLVAALTSFLSDDAKGPRSRRLVLSSRDILAFLVLLLSNAAIHNVCCSRPRSEPR